MTTERCEGRAISASMGWKRKWQVPDYVLIFTIIVELLDGGDDEGEVVSWGKKCEGAERGFSAFDRAARFLWRGLKCSLDYGAAACVDARTPPLDQQSQSRAAGASTWLTGRARTWGH